MKQVSILYLAIYCAMTLFVDGRVLTRTKRETEDCKIDVVRTSWSTGRIGQLRVKMPEELKVGDEVNVVVGFTDTLNGFNAYSNCLGVQNQLNDEDNEADIAFTIQQWMIDTKCAAPGVTMTFGYNMNYDNEEAIEMVIILVNDEEVGDEDQCVGGEEGGEEGGKEGGKEGGEILTGNVTCDKLFKVTANRPGQIEGYVEFISPVAADELEVEVGTDAVADNLILNGLLKDDEPAECNEVDGRVHFYTKEQKLVKGQTVRTTFNLNYDQNGEKPSIEGITVVIGDEEIYCGEIVECPDEGGEESGEGEEGEEKKDISNN